jgi:uncharacterized membrane protein YoaK (UPF0700 family)
MPLRKLTARIRTPAANWQLAALLAFTAGVTDVSGFLALGAFTSHMSGTVATIAAELHTRGDSILIHPALVLACFLAGAAFCAVLINWERRRDRESLFAVPVLLEALLLASLAFPGSLHRTWLSLATLSFAMGLQNAIITKISHAEIRTTHVTGMITDIGIELGRALYWNRSPVLHPVQANRQHLLLLTLLVGLFFVGGTIGTFAFPHIGFLILLPVAFLLAAFTILPITADLRHTADAH